VKKFLRRFAKKAETQVVQGGHISVSAADGPVRGHVDEALLTGDAGIFLRGWHVCKDGSIQSVAAVDRAGGGRVELPLDHPRISRRDVTESLGVTANDGSHGHGFLYFVPLDGQASGAGNWCLEYGLSGAKTARLPFSPIQPPDPVDGIRMALVELRAGEHDLASAFETTVGPCVEALWATKMEAPVDSRTVDFGEPVHQPAISVIVPLYGRVDFLRHQIASFSNDPDFNGADAVAELIYVLDDPRLESELLALARRVHTTYRLPFRIVVRNRNTGFSGANNAGAREASGELLLLLNSDVLPKSPGWLSRLAATHRNLPGCGALGCRLLYEDGSIQHAGMSFRKSPVVSGGWENIHPSKGFPVSFDQAGGPVEAPAVTAACMLVERELYRRHGGLAEDYILGDFEDSDFCLKLRVDGHKVWYTPDVELYHLERQSIKGLGDAGWRQNLTYYNMWRHGRRWGAEIEAAIAPAGEEAGAATFVKAVS
jgi:GT2 family glycosyltransferase